MKHILYYDKDIINSYAAQFFSGLPTKSSEEAGDSKEHEIAESFKDSMKKASISLGVISGEYTPSGKDTENIESKSQYVRELTEKVYHDNMLNCVMEQIRKESEIKLNGNNVSIGDYVCLTSDWGLIDVDYLGELFGKGSWNKIKELAGIDKNAAKNNAKNNTQPTENGIEALRKVIDSLKVVVPFKQIVASERFCIPINPAFLRESLREISFKYAPNQIMIFGRVTNKIQAVDQATVAFNNSSMPLNSIMPLLGSITSILFGADSYIITPIALYVE